MKRVDEVATKLLGKAYTALDGRSQKVLHHVAEGKHIARDVTAEYEKETTFGQRCADRVASFGGSWTFVGLFATAMLTWVGINSFLLRGQGRAFDPYPYILLNLFLSMLAAIQAPVILMSQNRHAERDRLNAEHDYEVNLKAELDIMLLHEKMDLLRKKQWEELLAIQQEQLAILSDLIRKKTLSP
ncbi:MAG: DUF1003 domain-containing protein [Acidobacteria bacterium]|nr:DUF1003 domain-containing protein [Acidobacteriota bacterium]MBI3487199.1 DUF1003 domain-containing protein [Acidobacteriota bacterium]